MTNILFAGLFALSMLSPQRGGDVVTVKNNGKEIKALAEVLFLKPGSYKAGPKAELKRCEIGNLEVVAPSDGLEAGDSLNVELQGLSGSAVLWKMNYHVAPGEGASFNVAEPANQDFNPNGKQPNMVGKFVINVVPLKRANQKGSYTASIMVK